MKQPTILSRELLLGFCTQADPKHESQLHWEPLGDQGERSVFSRNNGEDRYWTILLPGAPCDAP